MILYLVRHGETIWNREDRLQGTTDIDLTDAGISQAGRIADRLSREKVAAVFSSPLRRALSTALLIAQPHALQVKIRDGLKEMHQGELEGKRFEELWESYPEFVVEWRQRPTATRPPGGESLYELQERAWQVMEEIMGRDDEGVVVVSHNMTLLSILCRILGLPLENFRRLKLDLASLTIVETTERGPAIRTLNDTHHLDGLEGSI